MHSSFINYGVFEPRILQILITHCNSTQRINELRAFSDRNQKFITFG
jgi:hypothetical protein